MTRDEEKRKKKKKQQETWLEQQVIAILNKSLQAALKQAMDDLFKDWK